MKNFLSILVCVLITSSVVAKDAEMKDRADVTSSEKKQESRSSVRQELSDKEKAVLTNTKYIKSYFEVMEGLRTRSTIGGRRNHETTFPEHSLIAVGPFLDGNCRIFQECGVELIEYCEIPSTTLPRPPGAKALAWLSKLETSQIRCAREEKGITRSVSKRFELLAGPDLLDLQREVAKINSLDISQDTKRILQIGLLEDNRLYWQALKLTDCFVEVANNKECEEKNVFK